MSRTEGSKAHAQWTGAKATAAKKRVLAKYGNRCAVEGCETGDRLEIDHVIPLAKVVTCGTRP